jgi:hypothetical protein
MLETQWREPSDVFWLDWVALLLELLEGRVHIDGVPQDDDVDDQAERTELILLAFPPALVVPCVRAGTSEKGCCAECGAPWVRTVKTQGTGKVYERGKCPFDHRATGGAQRTGACSGALSVTTTTTGWKLSCDCGGDPVPCTVLDPFAGAFTTVLVALSLGRSAIGIELNPEYVEMARERILADAPLLNEEITCSID